MNVRLTNGICLVLAMLAWLPGLTISPLATAQSVPGVPPSEKSKNASDEDAVAADAVSAQPERPLDGVLPVGRAWEYSHYRVRVWICSDGSVDANNSQRLLPEQLSRLAQSCDPSGWEVLPEEAPARWRWKCLAGLDDAPETLAKIGKSPELVHDDKLTVILFYSSPLGVRCRARELDLNTNQWGALLDQEIDQRENLGAAVFSMVRTTFMPLAKIDRVTEQNEVYMRVRGANLCQFVSYGKNSEDEEELIVKVNIDSPVWVRPDDCFIPVLRKTDRDNKLVSQDPVAFTYIKVDPAGPPREADPDKAVEKTANGPDVAVSETAPEGAAKSVDAKTDNPEVVQANTIPARAPADETAKGSRDTNADSSSTGSGKSGEEFELGVNYAAIFGRVHSSFRAPLVARKSKHLDKLALVIRPPKGVTILRLTAADKSGQPMEGIKISSHPLDADRNEGWEELGKTDWRGMINIPPAVDGLRMIFMSRGDRKLMKIPVMPGFHPLIEATITNDEARLFAEGMISGMSNEILDVVAQREIHEKMIADYLAENKPDSLDKAKKELEMYRELPGAQQLRARLSDEKSRLQSQAKDKREEEFINKMFDSLESVLTRFVGKSKATDLLAKIQIQSGLEINIEERNKEPDPDNPEPAPDDKKATETPPPAENNTPDPIGGSGA